MVTKKFKIVALALIFSGALNIGLIAAFAFFMFQETPISQMVAKPSKKELQSSNGQVFAAMSRLSFRELVSFLTNRELLEEGYTKRDLAVAALVAFHHFHLEKALSAPPAQVRTLADASNQKIDLFPGLSDEQFDAIIKYAYQEKWPLTAKGLYLILQGRERGADESLEQAFFLTPEFYSLQLLFQKSGAAQENSALLHLALEGNWELLEKLSKEQAQVLDFSIDKRRNLLLSYIALHSPTAAELLLKTDFAFVVKRLEDRGILDLLSLLKKQTEEGTKLCIDLLRSPRSDAIWQAASMTLYSYAGEMATAPIDPKAVLARFAPETVQIAPAAPKPEPTGRVHIVKDGESLWKISRIYKVKVDEIVKLNGMEKDSLYPGMILKLPQGTGSEPPR
jgi:hypothetical protein